jgi:flagellar hook-basal body complex protein FliE
MSVFPVEAITAVQGAVATPVMSQSSAQGTSFSRMILDGIAQVDAKLVDADAMTTAFALDDSIPVHQVTYALEQARLSFQLMMEVRSRLVEGYQELMRMQV